MQTFLQVHEIVDIEKEGVKYKEVVFKLRKVLGNREIQNNVRAKRCFKKGDNEMVSNTNDYREDIFEALDRFPIMDVTLQGSIETISSTLYYIDDVEY